MCTLVSKLAKRGGHMAELVSGALPNLKLFLRQFALIQSSSPFSPPLQLNIWKLGLDVNTNIDK